MSDQGMPIGAGDPPSRRLTFGREGLRGIQNAGGAMGPPMG